jgi:hypothetical protein
VLIVACSALIKTTSSHSLNLCVEEIENGGTYLL